MQRLTYSPVAAWDLVVARLWKDILGTIEALIVPPLSERQTEMKPLSEKELDIVFKWLGVSHCACSLLSMLTFRLDSFSSTSSTPLAMEYLSRSYATQSIEVSTNRVRLDFG